MNLSVCACARENRISPFPINMEYIWNIHGIYMKYTLTTLILFLFRAKYTWNITRHDAIRLLELCFRRQKHEHLPHGSTLKSNSNFARFVIYFFLFLWKVIAQKWLFLSESVLGQNMCTHLLPGKNNRWWKTFVPGAPFAHFFPVWCAFRSLLPQLGVDRVPSSFVIMHFSTFFCNRSTLAVSS